MQQHATRRQGASDAPDEGTWGPMGDETYSERVTRLREERGWSKVELAERSGVPLRTVQSIEWGETKAPQRATRLALDAALGVEGDPERAQDDWPPDVRVFVEMVGAFLMAKPEAERLALIRALTRQIVGGRP